ncbi:MAG: DUF2868 domain-containing protein [Burkholderiaceae bacterium]
MNENDSRDLLLVQAYEEIANPAWGAEDRRWASDATARKLGSEADDDAYLVVRARLAAERLRERDPTARGLDRVSRWPLGAGWLIVGIGLLAGFAGDATGADRFINLLAPPLLGLIAWNLLAYAGLAISRLRGAGPTPRSPLARLWMRLLTGRLRRADTALPATASRFATAWTQATMPLTTARLARVLHLAAAALALGAIIGLYLRGLVFEYRAGWASTFLEPDQVGSLLALVFGPASLLTGIELPDPARLAAMRIPPGPGERAAQWIHLQAATLALVVVLPRLALALLAARRTRRLAESIALPLRDPYFAALLRARGGAAGAIQVIPYATELGQGARDLLASLLAGIFGASVVVRIAPSVPFGDEAEPAIGGACPPADWFMVLFRLAATPEREVQLRFVERIRDRLPPGAPLAVLIDDASFRARFADPARLAQRVDAWRRILEEAEAGPLVFLSLTPDAYDESLAALAEGIETAGERNAA